MGHDDAMSILKELGILPGHRVVAGPDEGDEHGRLHKGGAQEMHFRGLRRKDDFIGDNHISVAMAEMLFLRRGTCFGPWPLTLEGYQ
jgi:hypothetical protein